MTAQVSEELQYKGKTYMMCSEPLTLYLIQNPHIKFHWESTACWRGYIGKWNILSKDGKVHGLYLKAISGKFDNGQQAKLKDVFPGYSPNSPGVFAHWFSGEIRCPFGKQLAYLHMGYGSTYENDLFLEFERGILVNEYVVSNHAKKLTD